MRCFCTTDMLAIRWCLNMMKDVCIDSVFIQSDPLNIVDCINYVLGLANLDHIDLDCKSLLNSFKFSNVMHSRRCFTVDAHHMASLAKTVGSKTWFGCLPCVSSVVSDHVVSA